MEPPALDPSDDDWRPPYRRIAADLRAAIERGDLRPGDRLRAEVRAGAVPAAARRRRKGRERVGAVSGPRIGRDISEVGVTVGAILGPRLRALRGRAGLTQAAIGARVGCSQVTVSRWEAGERTVGVDDLVCLAFALGVSVGDLLGEELLSWGAP